ncbi:kinase-like domain, phloem protein 2-like protein [Tanacetum coccineum]|uniref:Kinase-like domain, phloem protein 2-like protein n=1 Tax=Tanacetum coccineum TaxID=301880 RepID=A0ABQ5GKW5_9ASTR
MGSETSHAYFTKHRDDNGWMMIELCRFLNQKEITVFEVSLESFVEAVPSMFRALNFMPLKMHMKQEEIKILNGNQQVPKPDVNKDQMQQMPNDLGETVKGFEHDPDGNKISMQSEVNGQKNLMISATKVLFIRNHQLSQVRCMYSIFKLSEKCRELHCPVKVRDLLHRRNKETKTLYFRTSAPFNRHDANFVPNQRTDGWMEVMVWKFNSKYKLANNLIPMNLKLIAYEGTLSGLTICGIDFRPM